MIYSERCKEILRGGGIGVMPTDTIYGVVGSAMKEPTVDRVYNVRHRDRRKPMIVLLSSTDDFRVFGIRLNEREVAILSRLWPAKVSVVLSCVNAEFGYLHCGTESIAFRIPDDKELKELLDFTGPVVAPSANPEGSEPAKTIAEAKDYFGADVDFYEDGGKIDGEPSTLVDLRSGKLVVLREGAVKVDEDLLAL